ncbi:hypothetical protein [Mycobacteroides abscessus]|uniref:hypothetical protein n=1 Tax=Mycobacteroides abscessus TaxID=36809 RepID=UPI00092A7403|nr:hypothetical protein [Mycobacteroides abscessus]SHV00848.1 Uncharacterised protein [Mycobacteroides abscessus subsp. abscessus]SHV05634.1 Uncharacterised protein [Mycobacteroides abscessus subsp. abscessus]SHV53509.1 Uncharacterised protein [Mycobacteroides abscessus subsp. abscessus]SHV85547.1 Uncharacterised protein [Mycobacteroides abscessus subsp. abscessus]SHY11462.1 Uncharacterised protein [Mycobacteroides abscessus subsp. abscessus]
MSETPIPADGTAITDTNSVPEGKDTGEQDPAPQNREARYRVERNEAREQLAAAELRLVQLQTRELHRLAGEILAVPSDIALSGKPLSDFLTPEGWVDKSAVEAAAREVAQARPGLATYQPAHDPSQGLSGTTQHTPSWDGLFDLGR